MATKNTAAVRMAAMLRRLSTVLSALSLLLCAATVVLWVRSYFRGDLVAFVNSPPPPAGSSELFVRSNVPPRGRHSARRP
jgi:hypothetical protein